jgi:hypothetical protein
MTNQARAATFGDVARLIRSKNAGPFWITIDVFFETQAGYLAHQDAITAARIAGIYRVAESSVRVFGIPRLRVIKISFPRPVTQGGPFDRDMHAGQQHVPLLSAPVQPEAADAEAQRAPALAALDRITL